MTDFAQELLEDSSQGDYVQIRYGTGIDQTVVEGTILSWSETLLKLKKPNGLIAKISLDDLRALDQLLPPEEAPGQPVPTVPPQSRAVEPVASAPKPQVHQSVGSKEFRVERSLVPLPPATPHQFSLLDWCKQIRSLMKESGNSKLKKELAGGLDSLQGAVKNHDIKHKYHDLRARGLNLWSICNSDVDYRIFYLYIGILDIAAEEYASSLEALVRAGEYSLAAYAASAGNLQDQAEIFSLCALLNKEDSAKITKNISEICVKRKDADILSELLELYQDDSEITEQLASCAYMMFKESKGNLLDDITPYESAFQTAGRLLEAVPPEWMIRSEVIKRWNEYRSYTYPASVQEDQTEEGIPKLQTGRIKSFRKMDNNGKEAHYGFINFINKDLYFHIKQVRDNTDKGLQLRKLLFQEQAIQLEVQFRLGRNTHSDVQDRPCANEIELTESAFHSIQEQLSAGGSTPFQYKGYIDDFKPYNPGYGSIKSDNGKRFDFQLSKKCIADPYLWVYLQNGFDPQNLDIAFEAVGHKAYNIYWLNRTQEDEMKFEWELSEEERRDWANFSQNAETVQEDESCDGKDPYEDYTYEPQPDWAEVPSKPAPFTWSVERKPIVPLAPTPASSEVSLSPKPTAPVPRTATTFVQGSLPSGGEHAQAGRIAAVQGRLSEAEQEYKQEIQANGPKAVVADLAMLYLRQDDRIQDAVAVLEEYGSCLPKDKLRNIKIQVYDKKKDYQALIPLYEESFQATADAPKKSHNLVRIIEAQIKLDRYADALESCIQWETLCQQNRFRADAKKLQKVSPVIQRQKAKCYYKLNRREEAKRIATDLIRSNPSDELANRILNDTLTSASTLYDSTLDDYAQDEEDMTFENEVNENESLITLFVRHKLQQTDIATSLKSPHLKEGKYTGTSKDALADVEKLKGLRNRSARDRSEALFAASKLYEIAELLRQREDGTNLNRYERFRLAGRAMASWGDYMVSQANQLDTTRMAYIFSLRVLKPGRRGLEQDWTNCFNRYIKSFFLGRTGSDSLDNYINQQTNSEKKDAANTDIFADHRIPDVLMPEFLVGMLNLIDVLERNYSDRQKALVEDLYYKNPDLRRPLCKQLADFTSGELSKINTLSDFAKVLHTGCALLSHKTDQLNQFLVEAGNRLMSAPIPDDLLCQLDPSVWKSVLTATDHTRLNQIHYVLKRSQDYFASSDFESRASCLRSTISEVKELLRVIQEEPTGVSYDSFLPALEQMHLQLSNKQTRLYQDFQPKLSWDKSLEPFRTPEGHIQIQLVVHNELNYQTADSVQILRVNGAEIRWTDTPETVPSLRGGEDSELSLVVDIDESANQSGSFSVTLEYTYKCNDAPQNTITKNQETEFTFFIRNENFEPLKNPFMGYEGKLMNDDSMFFGRSNQINQIVDMLRSDSGEMNYSRAIAMYGQTRTGKSSLMYHLKKRLMDAYSDKVIVWDIGNIGELPVRNPDEYMASFLYHLLDWGSEALYENDALAAVLEEEGIEPPLDDILQNPAFAPNYFNNYMKKLTSVLRQDRRIIVLMIDEFTYLHTRIKEGRISADFMQFWKALLQNYCIFAIVVGQDDMPEFIQEYQNEFACMELMKVTYLDEPDAKLLIQEPLERINGREGLFRRDAVDKLYELTAGSAYLTIILCSKLVNYLNEKGAYQVTRGIVEDFLRTRAFGPNGFLTKAYFEPQLRERGHDEYDTANKDILVSIARLSQTTGLADVNAIACDGLSQEAIQRLVDRLVDRNVLVKEGRSHYWIQVKLLEKWLISTEGM